MISLAVGYVRSIGIRTLHCISGVVRRYWDKYIESYEEALSSFVGAMRYLQPNISLFIFTSYASIEQFTSVVGYVRSIGIRTLHCISGVVRRYWDKYIESYEEALSSFLGAMEYCNQISPCLFSLHTHPLNSLHLIVWKNYLGSQALAARQLFLTGVVVGFAVQLLYNPSKSYLLVKDWLRQMNLELSHYNSVLY